MPLFKNERQAYIRRRRIYIDSDQRLPGSLSEFDFTVPLDNLLENVISIEMVGYNIKTDLQQTYVARSGSLNGNNLIDVHVDDNATNSNPLTYTVTIPPRNYTTLSSLATDLTTAFGVAVAATGNAYWIARPWLFGVFTLNTGYITIDCQFSGISAAIEENSGVFRFGTGGNKKDSGGGQLGFLTDEDTSGVLTDAALTFLMGTPLAIQPPELQPFRFMDVNITNAPELQPVGRIMLVDDPTDSKTTNINKRPRLLTDPIKRLDSLHVVCTMGPVFHGGPFDTRPPLSRSRGGIDLIFDVLIIAQEQDIPSWVQQELVY